MLKEEPQKNTQSDIDKILTTIIPTLNEAAGIARVIMELHSVGLRNILVVDGYSKDETVKIAEGLGARAILQQGKGKTGAIKTAVDHVQTPYMLVIDGDFTYDATCIGRLLQHMRHYDEIIGARVPVNKESMTPLHKFGNRLITKVFNILMNTDISDVCSGIYLLKTSTIRELNLSTNGFDVEVEIASQIASIGQLAEVPVNYRPRLGAGKLTTWKGGFKILKSIFKLARTYNPGVFYSMLCSLMVIPASILLAGASVEWMITGSMPNHWFLIGISMLLVAVQAMGVGVVSLILRRTETRMTRRLKQILEKDYSTFEKSVSGTNL